jgi:hypothetical protein
MPADTYDNLQNELEGLLVAASANSARRVHDLGLPLTVTEPQITITRDGNDPNAWQSNDATVSRNILASKNIPLFRLAPLLSNEVVSSAKKCASHIVELASDNLPFFSPLEGNGRMLTLGPADSSVPGASYENDAADWTMRHLLLPALYEHLKSLPSLRTVSGRAARSFASDVLKVATASNLQYLVTIPLAGVKVASLVASTSGGVVLRRLSSKEQGSLLADWGIATTNFGIALPLVVLELTISTARNAQNPDTREVLSKWLCALFLLGYDATGYRAQLRSHPSWVMPGTMSMPVILPPQPFTWSNVTRAKFNRLIRTVNLLKSYSISDPHSVHDLALHRFCSGAARASHVDGVLDFVIALESLLLPYDEDARRGDLGYRFRSHGAHLLSKAKSERRQVARRLTDLYTLRSRLVHGSGYPTPAEIESGWVAAREFARRGLYSAITDGFPTAADFKAMVLGV